MKIPGLEGFGNKNNQEKPPFLYHGSTIGGIEELNPRERHKPDEKIGARVYASNLPAWAAAHSWDWSSDEKYISKKKFGLTETTQIDTRVRGGRVILQIPKGMDMTRLAVPVYIYKVPSESFNLTSKEGSGCTYDSSENIIPIEVEKFNSVTEALHHYGGELVFV
jgi:hypothetical protein